MGDGVCDGGGGVGGEDMYNGRAEPVLVSVSDSYSGNDAGAVTSPASWRSEWTRRRKRRRS